MYLFWDRGRGVRGTGILGLFGTEWRDLRKQNGVVLEVLHTRWGGGGHGHEMKPSQGKKTLEYRYKKISTVEITLQTQ